MCYARMCVDTKFMVNPLHVVWYWLCMAVLRYVVPLLIFMMVACVWCVWCRNGNVIVHGGFDAVYGYMLVCSIEWIMC